MIIEVNGHQVEVDDSFADLSEEQQQVQLQEIVNALPKAEPEAKESASFVVEHAPEIGALGGALAGASQGPNIAKVIEPVVQTGAKKIPGQGVKNYIAATTEMPFSGGKDYGTAYQKASIAAGQPVKSRGSQTPIRRGSLGITTQPEPPPFLKRAGTNITSTPSAPAGRAGSALRMGAAGSLGGKAVQDIQQGNYGDAALHGTGALAALAGQSRYKPLRILGNIVAGGEVASGVAPFFTPKKPVEEKAAGGLAGYAKGKKVIEGGLEAAKKLFTPKQTKIVRASEALGQHEGKWLNTTQSDRMRSTGGDLGGPGFSKFQLENPDYAGAAWGVGKPGTATAIVNTNKRYPEGQAIWSPMIGSEAQHQSNQHVYDALTGEFNRQASMGKLTPELRQKMNAYLMSNKEYAPLFKKGIDVGNPESIAQMGDTFDRRGAISAVLSGKGVGGQKGQIFDYPGIMQEMTDPMTIGAPTHSVGTRLFSLNNQIEHRPDLHSAFPYILKGEDAGVAFNPVPKELAIPDWLGLVRDFKGREPGYMDYTRGLKGKGTPFQFIDDKYLRSLEEAGHKEGGPVGYAAGKKVIDATRKLILPPAENAARTQIIGTLPTYEKAGSILQQRGATGRGIDFGAGLGEGAKALGKDFDTYEPFAKNWNPTYSNAKDVPSDAYGQLTNLNVLNVVPREVRDEIVQDIGRVMQPGGMGIITTRGKDVMNAKGLAGPEPMSIITSRDTYQKGFNKDELEDYLKYMLGDKFDINRLNLGPAGAMIKKKAEGGLACMKEGGKTPAWQRAEGKNPEGGLNAAGRASYNRETGGNLKAPQPEGGSRKKSFCARMSGMKKKLTSSETANDPDSRINKSLRKWKC